MKTSSRFGGQNHTGLALRSKLRVGFLGPLSKIGANILSALPIISKSPTLDSLPSYSPPSEDKP